MDRERADREMARLRRGVCVKCERESISLLCVDCSVEESHKRRQDEWDKAHERGYVTTEEVERWTGTDRSTRLRRWWLAPDGVSRWDEACESLSTRLTVRFGREDSCGCVVLTRRRFRLWCVDCLLYDCD